MYCYNIFSAKKKLPRKKKWIKKDKKEGMTFFPRMEYLSKNENISYYSFECYKNILGVQMAKSMVLNVVMAPVQK